MVRLNNKGVHKDLSSWLSLFFFLLIFIFICVFIWASQVTPVIKNLPANAGNVRDTDSIPGSGRSPRGGHGNPL